MKPLHFLLLSWLVFLIAGGLWGVREKVHQTPDIFHQLFPEKNIEPVSFFGKKMWEMKRKPESRAIRQILDWFPINDFWHAAWYLIKSLYILGMWLAWKSRDYFLDFRKFWAHFIWVHIITTVAGGAAFWIIGSLL